jgi:hypothetical protein
MGLRSSLACCGLLLSIFFFVTAEEIPRRHRILVAQYQGPGGNWLIEVSAEGKLTWEHKVLSACVIFQLLPNDPILYAYGGTPTGVQEIDRDQERQKCH